MFCLVLILPLIVLADTNVKTSIKSNETVNYWAHITSPEANINIDGVDWETQYGNVTVKKYVTEVTETRTGSSFSVWDMVKHIERTVDCVLGNEKHCSEWNYRIWNALSRVFLPRWEYEDKVRQYEIRIKALEKTVEMINSTAYCQAKIDLMTEMELDWVICDGVKYYNINNEKGVTITSVKK